MQKPQIIKSVDSGNRITLPKEIRPFFDKVVYLGYEDNIVYVMPETLVKKTVSELVKNVSLEDEMAYCRAIYSGLEKAAIDGRNRICLGEADLRNKEVSLQLREGCFFIHY